MTRRWTVRVMSTQLGESQITIKSIQNWSVAGFLDKILNDIVEILVVLTVEYAVCLQINSLWFFFDS